MPSVDRGSCQVIRASAELDATKKLSVPITQGVLSDPTNVGPASAKIPRNVRKQFRQPSDGVDLSNNEALQT